MAQFERKKRVNLPLVFRKAAQVIQQASDTKGSIKNAVYQSDFREKKPLFALVAKYSQHAAEIDSVVAKLKLAETHPELNLWTAKILIGELLFGKGELKPAEAKPVRIIMQRESEIRNLVSNTQEAEGSQPLIQIPRYVRVNTIKISVEEAIERFVSEGWIKVRTPKTYSDFIIAISDLNQDEFMNDFHVDCLLVFNSRVEFHSESMYKQGQIFLQEKASCLAPVALNPEPGSCVIDACAAPGMKTSFLSAMVGRQGKVYAFDRNERRCEVLRQTIALCGANNVEVRREDFLRLKAANYRDVKYILVDPSCSGSGIVKRLDGLSSDTAEENAETRLDRLARFQVMLLKHALSFPSVQRVVYSTCSIHPKENEEVVQEAYQAFYRLFELEKTLENWDRRGCSSFQGGDKCAVADPLGDKTNGFFISVFVRRKWDDDLTL